MTFPGIHYVTDDDPVTFTLTPDGTVLLGTSEAVFAFRTLEHWDQSAEHVDRQREALDDDLLVLLRQSLEQSEWRKRSAS